MVYAEDNNEIELVKVTVEFPYRGKFYWGSAEQTILEANPLFQQWDEELRSAVLVWLSSSQFSREIIEYADEAWALLDTPFALPNGESVYLDEAQMFVVLDALMIVDTHAVEGECSWEEDGGFVVDAGLTEEFTFPASFETDDIVAAVYDSRGRDIFSFLREDADEYELIFRADEIADRVFFEKSDKKHEEEYGVAQVEPEIVETPVVQELPVTAEEVSDGLVTVRVLFPFRGFFQWDKQADVRLRDATRTWEKFKVGEVVAALNSDRSFRRGKVVKDFEVLWNLLDKIQIHEVAKVYGLSEWEMGVLAGVLTVPGTRGVQGTVNYEDEAKTRFIVDNELTQEVRVSHAPNGDYSNVVRQIVGNMLFRVEVVG